MTFEFIITPIMILFRQLSSNNTPKDSNVKQYGAINVQSIESYLADGTLWSKYVVVQSPGDDHCLMHSIVKALKNHKIQ